MSHQDSPEPSVEAREPKLSVLSVENVIARAQHLIDSRPQGEYPVPWYIEASHIGDLTAIAAIAALAARFADQQILIMRDFDAPRNLVYRAWTRPELVKRWWGGHRAEVTIAEIDLRVGGMWRYVMVGKAGLEFAFHGEYREIVPNKRIVSTELCDAMPEREAVNTVMFTEVNGRTSLKLLVHLASKQDRDAVISSGMEVTMQERMDLLEQVVRSLR